MAHIRIDVAEGLDRPGRRDARRLLQLGAEAVVAERLHAAVGVVDQHHLTRAEAPLRDRERADHVVGDDAAGVAQDVGLAVAQAEHLEDVQARVHARDDRQPAAGAHVQVPRGQRGRERLIVCEQLVDRGVIASAYAFARIFGPMTSGTPLELSLLPGARALLALHAREIPQRDDLCGAFCGALALAAAGVTAGAAGEPIDQDAVALAAGSVVGMHTDPAILPFAETGRRDYRLALPFVEDSSVSGTTAAGLARAPGGAGRRAPYGDPPQRALERRHARWRLRDRRHIRAPGRAARQPPHPPPVGIASRAPSSCSRICSTASPAGPPPDWDVGHFVCVIGRLDGPGGTLYGVADTYPSLGSAGVHLQPRERLARAIERPEQPAGGMLVLADVRDAPALRAGAAALGLVEGIWDNGTVAPDAPAAR